MQQFIFATGVPGSKWSAICEVVARCPGINPTDEDASRSYDLTDGMVHFGNYFGPGMEFGERFGHLDTLTALDITRELFGAYRQPAPIMLVKSHHFAEYLDYLRATFPQDAFLLVVREDRECLDWWQRAGGFSIDFPDYSWYREVEFMRERISAGNAAIRRFADRHDVPLKVFDTMVPVLERLGLRPEGAALDEGMLSRSTLAQIAVVPPLRD